MFDLIIANPPYGKSSSVSRKILNKIIESKIAEEIVLLAPPKTFIDKVDFIEDWLGFYGWENTRLFEEASTENLVIAKVNAEKVNKYKSYADCILDEKMQVLRNTVMKYNETRPLFYDFNSWSTLQVKEKGLLDGVDESLIFLMPIFTPSTLNGVAFDGESYKHNVLKEKIEYRKRASGPWNMTFHSQDEYNNFSKWWYGSGKRREKTLLNFMFDILYRLYGGDPSLNKYVEVLPNLDWTKEWTDEGILNELKDKAGLPIDWEL